MRRNALRSLPFVLLVAAVGIAGTPLPATIQGDTLVVVSLADHGPGSLRQVLADSLAGARIEIKVDGTIALESTLEIARSVTVVGPGRPTRAARPESRIACRPDRASPRPSVA